MRQLSRWLQTNPIVNLLMFLVTLISSVAGIVLGWNQLYQDYLSKTVEIPIWLLLLGLLLLPVLLAGYRALYGRPLGKELLSIEGKQFGVEQVILDGTRFVRCDFHGTEIIYEGQDVFSLERCEFNAPRFAFSKYAANTIFVLTKMYADPAFRPIIESTLENIRVGKTPQAVPPSSLKK